MVVGEEQDSGVGIQEVKEQVPGYRIQVSESEVRSQE
jgi:hypothetical protein